MKRDDADNIYKLSNWFNNGELVFSWDQKTNKCQVEISETGWVPGASYGMIYVCDLYHFNPNYGYDDFPCVYDPETKSFVFTLIYWYGQGKNWGVWQETFKPVWGSSASARTTKSNVVKNSASLAKASNKYNVSSNIGSFNKGKLNLSSSKKRNAMISNPNRKITD